MFGTIVTESGKGWWIVESDTDHIAYFVHYSNVADNRYLHLKDRVSFAVAPNPKKPGKMQAINVKWVGIEIAVQRGARETKS